MANSSVPTTFSRSARTGTYQLVSEPLPREDSSSSRSFRWGSPEDHRSTTKEERMMVLEGTILSLNTKFDQLLEKTSNTGRFLEELLRIRGGGEALSPAMAAPPPHPPPPPLQTSHMTQYVPTVSPSPLSLHHLPMFRTSSMGFLNPAFPSEPNLTDQQMGTGSVGSQNPMPFLETNSNQHQLYANMRTNHHVSQMGMDSMGLKNPMPNFEPILNPQQFQVNMRASPGQLPQFEQRTSLNQNPGPSQGFNVNPMIMSNVLDSSTPLSNPVQSLGYPCHQHNPCPGLTPRPTSTGNASFGQIGVTTQSTPESAQFGAASLFCMTHQSPYVPRAPSLDLSMANYTPTYIPTSQMIPSKSIS